MGWNGLLKDAVNNPTSVKTSCISDFFYNYCTTRSISISFRAMISTDQLLKRAHHCVEDVSVV